MEVCRDPKRLNRKRPSKRLAVARAALVCLGFFATPAAANHIELHAALTSLDSFEFDLNAAAARHAGERTSLNDSMPAVRLPRVRRYHKLKVIDYKREVKLLREDVVIRIKSPGKRMSILMVELKF